MIYQDMGFILTTITFVPLLHSEHICGFWRARAKEAAVVNKRLEPMMCKPGFTVTVDAG